MNVWTHPNEDSLLDLVNGLLPGERRVEILGHLRACGDCASRLRETARTHERAFARAELALRQAVTRRRLPILALPLSSRRPAARRAAMAAAGLIAVLGTAAALWTAFRPARHEMGAVAWLPAPEATVVARDSSVGSLDPRVGQGLAAYRLHDAERACRLLESAEAEGSLDQVRRLYLGNAQLQSGDASAAAATLGGVNMAQVPEPWRGEARWSLALALAHSGRTGEADSLWRLLSEREDEIGARARRALEMPAPRR